VVKKRVIPVILLRDGQIVQSRRFARYNILGSPTPAVERISKWSSDELVYLDITDNETSHFEPHDIETLIPLVAARCSVPLTFGGGVRSLEDARRRLRLGADKITLNTMAVDQPELIEQIAGTFGVQCVVVSMDVRLDAAGRYEVFKRGRVPTGRSPTEFARAVEARGAGEILLNSVDRDGTGQGFDLELVRQVCDSVRIPVIALGGASSWEHFAEVLQQTNAAGVAAANVFQHVENSVYHCKEYLYRAGFPVRKPPPLSSRSDLL
jgi:cyclase